MACSPVHLCQDSWFYRTSLDGVPYTPSYFKMEWRSLEQLCCPVAAVLHDNEADGRPRKVGKASLQDAERPRLMQWPSEAMEVWCFVFRRAAQTACGVLGMTITLGQKTQDFRHGWDGLSPANNCNRLASQLSELSSSGICSSHILPLQQLLLTKHQFQQALLTKLQPKPRA